MTSSSPTTARLAATAALVAALLAPTIASAQARRVTVAELEGRRTAAARRAITDGLRDEGYEIVDAGADATIEGRAVARGSRWRVDLTVRSAAGEELGQVRMRVAGGRGVRRLVARLDEILESAPAQSAAPAAAAPEDVAAPPASDDVPLPPPTAAPDAPPTADARDRAPARSDPDGALPIHALVQIGAGIRSRSIEILSPDGVDAAYRVEPYFEITARAEARFFDIAFVRARFGSSAGLSSEREDPSLPPLDTLFVWLRADAGASYIIDDTVELGAAFGVGWDRYELAFNELIPTAEYVHLRPAFVTAFYLVDRLLVLDAEVGVRIPFGVGDLASVYGVDHEVYGLDGAMRLRGVIDPGFAWAVEAGFRQYWLEFRRPSGVATGNDAGWHLTGYAGWRF